MAKWVKNLLAMKETWVQSLDKEDPQEKEMATHCSILAWKVPRTEELDRLSSWGCRLGHDLVTANTNMPIILMALII